MIEQPKRGRGAQKGEVRRRKHSAETPRKIMAFRVNAPLYEQIAASALANQYSLTEEIEKRLEASFQAETYEQTLRRVIIEELQTKRGRFL